MIHNENTNTVQTNVYNIIKNEIVKFNLVPGQKITENKIAEKLNVSRTPVREAFLRLKQEGLIVVYPQRGSFISLIDPEHVEEARYMRATLEIATVELAFDHVSEEMLVKLEENLQKQKSSIAEKRYEDFFEYDQDFHKTIFEACNKLRVWDYMQGMMFNLNRIRMLSLASNYHWETLLLQHEQIIDSMRKNERDQARQVMTDHMGLQSIDFAKFMQEYPQYFYTASAGERSLW